MAKEVKSKGLRGDKLFVTNNSLYTDYLVVMSHSPRARLGRIDQEFTPNWFQLAIAGFFTAVIIMITRMHSYERDMGQFYWSNGSPGEMVGVSDFFSYYKMTFVVIMGVLAMLVLLYHVFCQTLVIRKSNFYIPMAVYSAFVILSYITSDYKDFALYGYNDRFEGTVPILCYMIMLFYIINLVTSEKAVKWIIYPVAGTSVILGLLGVSQALDIDFFRTGLGKRLITPSSYWGNLDGLSFTFQNREIYQTVYNINYVSFYLTLLVPLFAMLFIREHDTKKKVAWGGLFALSMFNMIGSQSSGGILGLAVMLVMALIVLNKRLIEWKKPIAILLVLILLMGAATFNRFAPELFGAVNSVLGKQVLVMPGQEKTPEVTPEETPAPVAPALTKIDYFETLTDTVSLSLNGNPLKIKLDNLNDPMNSNISVYDASDAPMNTQFNGEAYVVEGFDTLKIRPAQDNSGQYYLLLTIDAVDWPFMVKPDGIVFVNQIGKQMQLVNVPHIGFENNQAFGSGRGFIWSRSLPMLKDTIFLGKGADTYCIYFPHKDYAGKYGSGVWTNSLNIVVDKPHDLYIGMAFGTGITSLLAFLALVIMYWIQSFRIYRRLDFKDGFLPAVGVGIFLGTTGFMAAALVNDSTISVMPMFYGLLGTGIAINYMIGKKLKQN